MSDKDFKVKNKLILNGLTQVGPLVADANKQVDATPYLTTLQGGTGTTTSPASGQVLYSSSGTTYAPTTLTSLDVKGATYSADAPSSPVVGQVWIESDSSSDSFDPNIMRRKTITATAGQTTFTTDLTFIQGYEQVYFNGMLLLRTTDYTTPTNTTVELTSAAAVGDIVEILSITNLNSINAATTTTNVFTGSQTIQQSTGHSLTVDHTSTSGYSSVWFKENGGSKGYLAHFGSTSGDERIQLWNEASSGAITFGTNNAERMRIDSSGRVSFGSSIISNSNIESYHIDSGGYAYRIRANASNNAGNLQFTNNSASTDWAYIGSPSAGTMVIRTPNGATSPGNNSWLGLNGGPVQIRDVSASGGETSDWPVPSLSIVSYDDYVRNTMLAFLLKNDDNYILSNTIWNFKLADSAGATASSSTTHLFLNGPGIFSVNSPYITNSEYGQDLGIGGTWGKLGIRTDTNNIAGLKLHASASDFYVPLLHLNASRSNNTAFNYIYAISTAAGTSDVDYYVRGDGQVFTDGSSSMSTPADYAEYFEWADGNPNNEDRAGYSVSLINGTQIKIAEEGEEIIGIVSANPAVVGDAAWNNWTGKYQKDEFNRYIRDENGDRILSENFDPESTYIPREERPEWSPVGMVGKLRMRKGQLTDSRWIKMRDVSAEIEEWLVR